MNKIHQQIKSYSLKNPKEEICGLITDKEALQCNNLAEDKASFYQIDPKDYLRISLKNEIRGVFHSHISTRAALSHLDILNAEKHQIKTVIYSVPEDNFLEYEPCDFKIDYVGREFSIGKMDCYSIVKEYYEKELNIFLPDFFRDGRWIKNTPDLYESNYCAGGFVEVDEIKKSDLLLFKFPQYKFAHHAGIYLDNSFLHHEEGRYSTIELYAGIYKRYTHKILRHKTLC